MSNPIILTPEQIEYGNLKGEVAVLRELMRGLLARELSGPTAEATNALMTSAFNHARSKHERLSAERISVDHAINQLTRDLGYS
ncbi:hypothetical protein [Pseudomonas sp. CGJS7]|uniref:hypothetical protein n=1 Tax=Pseudomonas sp. CGJS7 TaxID=3109348 RepID=UPI00300B2DC5